MNNDVLTLQEAATFLQISTVTLRHLARRGEVPGTKLGRQWRFSRVALEEHLGRPQRAVCELVLSGR